MSDTIKELRRQARTSAPMSISFDVMMWLFDPPDYASWVGVIERVIVDQMRFLGTRRNELQKLDENAVTTMVVNALHCYGLEARSAMVNGNCDVTVSRGDYLWLGEAKIMTGATVVWGGYRQLIDRYATGLHEQNHGAMLIYCFKDQPVRLLAEWRKIIETDVNGHSTRDSGYDLSFRSSDVCGATGLPLHVAHFAFPLHHQPTEETSRPSRQALAAGKQARAAQRGQ